MIYVDKLFVYQIRENSAALREDIKEEYMIRLDKLFVHQVWVDHTAMRKSSADDCMIQLGGLPVQRMEGVFGILLVLCITI